MFHSLTRDQFQQRLAVENPICESNIDGTAHLLSHECLCEIMYTCGCDTGIWTVCSVKWSHLHMLAGRCVDRLLRAEAAVHTDKRAGGIDSFSVGLKENVTVLLLLYTGRLFLLYFCICSVIESPHTEQRVSSKIQKHFNNVVRSVLLPGLDRWSFLCICVCLCTCVCACLCYSGRCTAYWFKAKQPS